MCDWKVSSKLVAIHYEDIGEIAGVNNRDQIKRIITVAMGASDETGGYGSLYTEGFNKAYVRRIHDAALKRFPKLQLFKGWESMLRTLTDKYSKM